MAIIDKGEKHLFIRRLLQSDDSVIAWGSVVDITFELSFLGEETVETWSKVIGGVTQSGDSVRFELDSGSIDKGTYYLKATLVVNDDTWNSGTSDDITWETEKIQVIETPTPTNPSSSTGDLKFDVTPESDVEPPANPPTQGAFATSQTTATTANLPYTSVDGATYYEYELESGGGAVDNDNKLRVELTGLNPDSTDRWRVRAGNSADVSDWSPYQSFTTNPSVTPTLVGSVTTGTNSASYTIEDEGLEVEYFRDGSWISLGVVTNISLSSLAENTAFAFEHRFRNSGGVSLDANGNPITSTISFTTNQAVPTSAPVITTNQINTNGGDYSHTSIASATNYQINVESEGYQPIGLSQTYSISDRAQNVFFDHVIRAINNGGEGPDSAATTTLTKISEAPTFTLASRTTSSITINIQAISGQPTVTYYARIDGGAYVDVGTGNQEYTGLNNGQEYTFDVYAENASGDGPVSTQSFTTTDAPEKVVISNTIAGDNYIEVYFGEVANADYYEARVDLGTAEDIGTSSPGVKTGLSLNTTYLVQVRAVNDITGAGAWSDAVEEDTLAVLGDFQNEFTYEFQ